ncbi:MAG: BMC domain-containing protein, partial [Spirochaetales bacterium]|nr:BMC domain-containing protein [Spirochaetales bacterium]
FSAVSIIDAADASAKEANVTIYSISLLQGLGGKAFALIVGTLSEVAAAIEAAGRRIPDDMFVESQIIPEISRAVTPFLPGRD